MQLLLFLFSHKNLFSSHTCFNTISLSTFLFYCFSYDFVAIYFSNSSFWLANFVNKCLKTQFYKIKYTFSTLLPLFHCYFYLFVCTYVQHWLRYSTHTHTCTSYCDGEDAHSLRCRSAVVVSGHGHGVSQSASRAAQPSQPNLPSNKASSANCQQPACHMHWKPEANALEYEQLLVFCTENFAL